MTRSLALLLALAPRVAAQVSVDVGPDPAPLGCPVFASVTNGTDLVMGIGGCPWRVLDADLEPVFVPDCVVLELLVGPLGTVSYRWDQQDQAGSPVPPGLYHMEVATPLGTVVEPFLVGGVDANLHLKGTPAIGTDAIGFGGREIAVCAPAEPGGLHWVLASFAAAPGISTCGGTVPLAADALLDLSLAGGLIVRALGPLDGVGFSDAPLLPIPDQPSLVGVDLVLAFVVLDLATACPVAAVSPPLALVVAPGPQPLR